MTEAEAKVRSEIAKLISHMPKEIKKAGTPVKMAWWRECEKARALLKEKPETTH